MEALKQRATNEELIHLKCPIHNYFGIGQNTTPTKGCVVCSKVQILTILATKSGDMNDNLSQLEAILHGACELDSEGKFDYLPERPKFMIEKGKS
jgi:hypothetical protein